MRLEWKERGQKGGGKGPAVRTAQRGMGRGGDAGERGERREVRRKGAEGRAGGGRGEVTRRRNNDTKCLHAQV